MQAYQLNSSAPALWSTLEPEMIDLAERLDSTTAPVIERTVDLLMKTGARQMVLNATRTRFMTGAGLRSILAAARALQQAEGQLVVCNLSGQPKDMFEQCSFDNLIAVFSQPEDAVNALAA